MSKVVIRAVQLEGFAMVGRGDVKGNYLQAFDVDAFDGRGDATFTDDKAKALVFDSLAKAFETWKTQSTIRPLRPDGKPNRPLTAFTITFEQADEP